MTLQHEGEERPATSLWLASQVEKHALEHYQEDGWDWIYETRDVPDLAEEITEYGITTLEGAIAHFLETAKLLRDRSDGWWRN